MKRKSFFVIVVMLCMFFFLAFSDQKILKVDVKSMTLVVEKGNVDYFSWSPDGEKFIYAIDLLTNWGCEREILLVEPNKIGSGKRPARKLNKEEPLPCGFREEWLCDGTKILIRNYGGISGKTYSLDLETGNKKEVLVPANWVIFYENCSPTSNAIVCNTVYFDSSKWTGKGPESIKYGVDFYHP